MFVKKHFGAAFLAALLCLSGFSAFAQEGKFDDSVLSDLKNKAQDQLRNSERWRFTVIEESFEKGSPAAALTENYISERISPDRSRSIFERKTKDGIERTEYIDIGTRSFVRKNNGDWKIFKPTGSGSGVGAGSGSGSDVKLETTTENKLKRGVKVGNQKADYYETVTTYKWIYPTKTIVRHHKRGFWFDSQGRYVKTLEENFNEETGDLRRKTTVYEYNPKLKIEAPIKVKE